MLVNEKIKVVWHVRTKNHYESLGYKFSSLGSYFEINVGDLPKGSHQKVKLVCDYCNQEYFVVYKNYLKQQIRNINKKDCCVKCKPKKIEEFSLMKYGNKSRKYTFEFIIKEFKSRGLDLLEVGYHKASIKMKCRCNLHPNIIQEYSYNDIQQGSRCKYCSWDKLSRERRYGLDEVKLKFEESGLILIEDTYVNATIKLQFKCKTHPDEIQKTTFQNILVGGGCKYCRYKKITGENNYAWQGGVSELSQYLREKIPEWKKYSMQKSNFKCVITKKRFDVIHHLYGFDMILEEILSTLNYPLHSQIGDYSKKQLDKMIRLCKELHVKYGPGVCLTKEVHREFHLIYGYGKNTPEQFEEFKKMKKDK